MDVPPLFAEAVKAAQSGDRPRAFDLMRQVLMRSPNYVPAWLWMSTLVDSEERERECLNRVLALDPQNREALHRLEVLRLRNVVGDFSVAERYADVKPLPRLGDYLVQQGFISQAQLREALAEQGAKRNRGIDEPLGDLLVRRGWLSVDQLARALVMQGQDKQKPAYRQPPQRLGEFLLREGLVTPQQLEAALAEQTLRRQRGERVNLGELLVRSGYLTKKALQQALQRQREEYDHRYD